MPRKFIVTMADSQNMPEDKFETILKGLVWPAIVTHYPED